jgi:hypothetical protein
MPYCVGRTEKKNSKIYLYNLKYWFQLLSLSIKIKNMAALQMVLKMVYC